MQNNFTQLLFTALLRDTNKKLLRETVKDAVDNAIDWNSFFLFARRNGVLPLIYTTLKKNCSDILPESIIAKANQTIRTIALSNLGKVSVLIHLTKLLSENNILTVPIKGPSLACVVYKDLSLRSFGDLDVLIHENDVPAAYKLLCASGYTPEMNLSSPLLQQIVKTEDDYNFVHNKTGIIIELHWELSGRLLQHALTLNCFVSRLTHVQVLNHDIHSLGNEDLLIYLCIHGSKHIWGRLEWLFAIHEIIRLNNSLNWELIFNLSKQWSARRMLFLSILASHELFQTPLPSHIIKKLILDQQAVTMAAFIINKFQNTTVSSTDEGNSRFSFWQLKCMDSYPGKLRMIMIMLFNPTIEDYRKFKFPKQFHYAYYICRPIRLLWIGFKTSRIRAGNNSV